MGQVFISIFLYKYFKKLSPTDKTYAYANLIS